MATARGRQPSPLTSELLGRPERFEFFQAVRLLHAIAAEAGSSTPGIGRDGDPQEEPVRLRTRPSLTFPTSQVTALRRGEAGQNPSPPEMTVSFLGLIGTSGPLPDHYTELVIRRLRDRDTALNEFLALFDHRTLSLFYRAWEKYRMPVVLEAAARSGTPEDPVTLTLQALVGRATRGHRDRLEVHDDVFLRFAGHFSRRARPASSLRALLADYFEVPVRVEQFVGEVLCLPLGERTALPSEAEPMGHHNRLGETTILGALAEEATGRFRIVVGPLSLQKFNELMPSGDLLRPFCQLVRSFVGPHLAFDVCPVLAPGQAPPIRLGADPPHSPRLGWNTFVRSKPVQHEFSGICFSLDPS